MNKQPLNIISLGAGVQSSAMALMAAHGELTPTPDLAMFADVGAEPGAVYEWLDWLESVVSDPLRVPYPFPIQRVSGGNLTADVGKQRPTGKTKIMPLPVYILTQEGNSWKKNGLLNRQCTADYKIRPLHKAMRQRLGIYRKKTPPGIHVIQWLGISIDEVARMKPSRQPWLQHRHPLIDNNISRRDCIKWMKEKYDLEPPRSACTYCPFHSNAEWRRLRDEDPAGWAEALEMDERVRDLWGGKDKVGQFFLHKSYEPLALANLEDETSDQLDLFNNECEGMCGV